MINRICLFFVLCFSSCENHNSKFHDKNNVEEKFDIFYNKFLSDSIFQVSRIKFPLSGEYIDSETVGLDSNGNQSSVEYVWKKENWNIFHKVEKEDSTNYIFETIKNENKVTIIIKGNGFGIYMEQRFERIDDKWYLIYLIDRDL